MKLKKLICICIIICSTSLIDADNNNFNRSKHLYIQYAGNLGVVGLGFGKCIFWRYLETSLFYGYVPASIGGTDIHTFALRNHLFVNANSMFKIYLGCGINAVLGPNTFFKLPDYFPKEYHQPTGVHAMPYAGIIFTPKNKRINIYLDACMLDTDFYNYITNSESASPISDILTLGLGIIIPIGSMKK